MPSTCPAPSRLAASHVYSSGLASLCMAAHCKQYRNDDKHPSPKRTTIGNHGANRYVINNCLTAAMGQLSGMKDTDRTTARCCRRQPAGYWLAVMMMTIAFVKHDWKGTYCSRILVHKQKVKRKQIILSKMTGYWLIILTSAMCLKRGRIILTHCQQKYQTIVVQLCRHVFLILAIR